MTLCWCRRPATVRQKRNAAFGLCREHYDNTIAYLHERDYDLAREYEPVSTPTEPPPDLIFLGTQFSTIMRRRRMWASAAQEYCDVVEIVIVCERCNAEIKNSVSHGEPFASPHWEYAAAVYRSMIEHYITCIPEPVSPPR